MRLTFVSGVERLKSIRDLPLVDVEIGGRILAGELLEPPGGRGA